MENIEELASQIKIHNESFFNGESKITDTEFDLLVAELKSFDPNHPILMEVGSLPSWGRKVTHSSVMGSLSKVTYNEEGELTEVTEWIEEQLNKGSQIVSMPKIDGLAISLKYNHGELSSAVTRGNGLVGQDVKDNVLQIKAIPNTIEYKEMIEIRGEIYMQRNTFEEIKKEMIKSKERIPANPRNMASGTLNQKDPNKTAKKPLSFFSYDIIKNDDFILESDKADFAINQLSEFIYVDQSMCKNINEVLFEIKHWEDIRKDLNYDIDGLVFSVQNIEVQEEMGWTGKCPNGKMAFKFKPEQTVSEILDIDWQLGRTGRLTPVAKIKPVTLAGTSVSSPTLHNFSQIIKKNIAIGDKIYVEKAGDIIPQIVCVKSKGEFKDHTDIKESMNFPFVCPICNSETSLDEDEVNVWCLNPACEGQKEHKIHHYLKMIGVLDVGSANVRDMLSTGIISSIPDLYEIDQEKLSKISGYGKKSAKVIVNEINKIKDIPLSVFLSALGISGLGKSTGKTIASEYVSISGFINSCNPEDLKELPGIGDILSVSIFNGVITLNNMITELYENCVNVLDCVPISGSLSDSSFCITGTLSMKRKDMAKMIEDNGGEIKSSVGKGLDFLVAGEGVGAAKTKKAEKYGTTVINEDRLMEMLNI